MKKHNVKSTEMIAIDFVKKYEKRHGRIPVDVSKKGVGYDIRSGNRLIEVKGQSAVMPDFIYLYKRTLQNLGDNILNYYIYLVYDVKNKPKLKILLPRKIFGNIEIDPQFIIRGKVFKALPIEKS